jgi:hypothetical protein
MGTKKETPKGGNVESTNKPNNDRSDTFNPNNAKHKAAIANTAKQITENKKGK